MWMEREVHCPVLPLRQWLADPAGQIQQGSRPSASSDDKKSRARRIAMARMGGLALEACSSPLPRKWREQVGTADSRCSKSAPGRRWRRGGLPLITSLFSLPYPFARAPAITCQPPEFTTVAFPVNSTVSVGALPNRNVLHARTRLSIIPWLHPQASQRRDSNSSRSKHESSFGGNLVRQFTTEQVCL
jgi:hypothetical protein